MGLFYLCLFLIKKANADFQKFFYNGKTYEQIIKELNPSFDIEFCHLDPDIRDNCISDCPSNWRPAFGQQYAALSHLKKFNVGIGDIFIFFGWFRQTELQDNGKLSFIGPDKHIIYGFMEVGDIIKGTAKIAQICPWHPHSKKDIEQSLFELDDNNWLFIPKENRYKVFKYNEKLVLTKNGMSRSKWDLPEFFRDAKFSSVCSPGWGNDFFQKTGQWQELIIIDPSKKILDWAENIINN